MKANQCELARIQQALSAPKNKRNSFGGYNYRSCEDILEAVKPLLGDAVLTISDEIVEVGGRVYVRATARLAMGGEAVEVSAYAREAETKKGMDEAQITGSASSYARKYALNGLFCIDDNADPDATHGKESGKAAKDEKPFEPATEQQVENIRILFDQAEMDGDARNTALRWASGNRETNAERLSSEEAAKLIAATVKKIEKKNAELRDRHESATPPKPNDLPL